MYKSLKRILKLRELKEETRRTQLVSDLRDLAEISANVQVWHDLHSESRHEAFACLGQNDTDGWLLAGAEQELSCWQRKRLLPLQAQAEAVVNGSRADFLESRKERRQGEVLLESKLDVIRVEALRREQSRLDEWFRIRRALQEREKKARTSS